MLCHPACRAIAVEASEERVQRIHRNAAALGVPALQVVAGSAPQALAGLAAPDAIFIGGGASRPQVFETCWAALKSGGRLVVNAVSLDTEALLLGWFAALGGELRRLSVERAEPLGSMHGWRPAMTITQWSVRKP